MDECSSKTEGKRDVCHVVQKVILQQYQEEDMNQDDDDDEYNHPLDKHGSN